MPKFAAIYPSSYHKGRLKSPVVESIQNTGMNSTPSLDLALSVLPAPNDRVEDIPVARAFYNAQDRAVPNLQESPKRKFICNISIMSVCLDRSNLPAAPVSRYVVLPPNITTYTKKYYLKNATVKPVPFMHPMYVSHILFAYWQSKVEHAMQMCYEAARVISTIPACTLKDAYWCEWKASVYTALDTIVEEIAVLCAPLDLVAKYAIVRGDIILYIESILPGRIWAPPVGFVGPLPLPPVISGYPSFRWDPAEIKPANAYAFLMRYVNNNQPVLAPPTPARKPLHVSVSTTTVPLCAVSLFYIGFDSLPRQPTTGLIIRLPYIAEFGMVHSQQSERTPIPFMDERVVSAILFGYLQRRVEAVAMKRYAVAVAISTITTEWLKNALIKCWINTSEQDFRHLAHELTATFLAPMGLKLRYAPTTGIIAQQFFIQSTTHRSPRSVILPFSSDITYEEWSVDVPALVDRMLPLLSVTYDAFTVVDEDASMNSIPVVAKAVYVQVAQAVAYIPPTENRT